MKPDATSADESVPFDETAVTRGRHKCYFCDAEKSDEWKFLAKLNTFICRACLNYIEGTGTAERKAG
ncbi:MAG TPA: hypothetical protein PLB01_06110 [Thermoanaerobaculia bacterium]|nr:hypothetical protein [Thermoanaerobaculia bacterium]